MRYDLEVLSEGKTIDKPLSFELTYKDIYSGIDNLWSVLFTTGYLTQRGRNMDGTYRLAIPNREIRRVFREQVQKWFLKKIEGGLLELYKAFDNSKAEEIEKQITACLKESISFMDGGNTEEQKEASYHMLLIGMVQGHPGWLVKSNREAGGGAYREAISNGTAELAGATLGTHADTRGRADIIIIDRLKNSGIIIEVKHTNDEKELQAKAEEACQQIKDMNYNEYFIGFQIDKTEEYGIAFCGKTCKVLKK